MDAIYGTIQLSLSKPDMLRLRYYGIDPSTSLSERLVLNGHTYSKSMKQPGKVANPVCGQLNKENEYFPVPVRA